MALSLNGYETEHGITVNGAYMRIEDVYMSITKSDGGTDVIARIRAPVYYNVQASDSGDESDVLGSKRPIANEEFYMPVSLANVANHENIIRMGYLFIKQQDGFTDASDV